MPPAPGVANQSSPLMLLLQLLPDLRLLLVTLASTPVLLLLLTPNSVLSLLLRLMLSGAQLLSVSLWLLPSAHIRVLSWRLLPAAHMLLLSPRLLLGAPILLRRLQVLSGAPKRPTLTIAVKATYNAESIRIRQRCSGRDDHTASFPSSYALVVWVTNNVRTICSVTERVTPGRSKLIRCYMS